MNDGNEATDGHEAVRAEYDLTVVDLLRATVIATLASRVSSAVAGFFFVMGAYLIANDDPLGWLGIGLGLLVFTGLYSAPFIWWAALRRADLVVGRRQLVADASGIRITAPTSTVEITWDAFRTVRVWRDGLYLTHGTGFTLIIPTRSFTPGEVDAFRALAQRAGKLDISPRWPRTVVGLAIGAGITAAALLALENLA